MANITISDLHLKGSDLFIDSESYMAELNSEDFDFVVGGISPVVVTGVAVSTEVWMGIGATLVTWTAG